MQDKFIGTAKLKTYIQITRITIVICWISLLAFWAIKLFGGNFFEIIVENDNFVKFSEKVETTWLKYLVSFITVSVANYLIIGAICQKFYFKGKQAVVVGLAIFSIWVVSNFVSLSFFNFPSWYAYLIFAILGIVYQKKRKKLFGVLPIILEPCFSIISFSIRGIPIIVANNYLIAYVLSIDIYIMFSLYYLYSNLKNLKKEI